jgi:exosortase family protein XrtF
MKQIKNFKEYLAERSVLDMFLIKSGALLVLYFILQISIKYTPIFKPVFIFFKHSMTKLILVTGDKILVILGYDSKIYKNILYIQGSDGVKIINACLGWSMMALFTGFILAYPSYNKSKYWFIPLGLVIIIAVNILRITGMVLISYISPESLDFYHHYIFKIVLYLIIFILWIIWLKSLEKQKTISV